MKPVDWLVAVTVAPGTSAPEGSVTSPRIVPVTVWATAGSARLAASKIIATLDFSMTPPGLLRLHCPRFCFCAQLRKSIHPRASGQNDRSGKVAASISPQCREGRILFFDHVIPD